MTICFDLDGTLLDVRPKYERLYRLYLNRHDGRALPMEEFWQMKRSGISNTELCLRSGLPEATAAGFGAFVRDEVESAESLNLDQVFHGVPKALTELADRFELCLVSCRRDRAAFEDQLERRGLRDYFRNVGVASSDRESLRSKACILGEWIGDSRSLVVGDSEADLDAGRRIGAATCALTSGVRTREFLVRLNPDFVARGIEELPDLADRLNRGAIVPS